MKVKIKKSDLVILCLGVFVILMGGVYAYTQAVPNPGHGADELLVDVPGVGEKTLQEAIDDGDIPGVNEIVAGSGVSVDPSNGKGIVTISGS